MSQILSSACFPRGFIAISFLLKRESVLEWHYKLYSGVALFTILERP